MLSRVLRASVAGLVAGCFWACSSDDGVIISEFMASNGTTLADEDKQYSDWIELHNGGKKAVDLDGWFLSDQPDVPRRFRLPAVELGPGDYLIVFASGKNRASPDGELHTNFRLKALSDHLALIRWDGSVRSVFNPYPDQLPDVSYGRTSAGRDDFLARPTPGGPNSEARPRDAE